MSQRPSEDALIARFFAPLAGEGGLGLKDDAASFTPRAGYDLVLTVDTVVAGVHFFPDDPPASIARKALAVNISDLAAKGAEPAGFLLSLALPEDWTEDWLSAFAGGLGEAARDFRCSLLGGDTVKAMGALTLSITALGEVPAGRMVRRSTAQAGDILCVSGTIGDSALGLALRSSPPWSLALPAEQREHLADRYLHPQPRLALGAALRDHARASMDVSDGLAGDLAKMMRASGVSAVVNVEQVPLSPAARSALRLRPDLIERILTGGDDYEILCAVPKENMPNLREMATTIGIPLTAIGEVVAGGDLPVFRSALGDQRFAIGSFSHF
jgi:thiamine-monophosphate kinase